MAREGKMQVCTGEREVQQRQKPHRGSMGVLRYGARGGRARPGPGWAGSLEAPKLGLHSPDLAALSICAPFVLRDLDSQLRYALSPGSMWGPLSASRCITTAWQATRFGVDASCSDPSMERAVGKLCIFLSVENPGRQH